ncbi:MAG TPA: hypothetical protein VL221_12000 [Bacteroidota bacterium]|nr:hypothetical protein [Bacteroidota bacterium]
MPGITLAQETALSESLLEGGEYTAVGTDLESEFTVRPVHLVALCDAVLKGELKAARLEVLASVLVRSEKFMWDPRTKEGGLVSRVIYAWEAPEINYVLSTATAAKFRHMLVTGENEFDDADWSDTGRPDVRASL